jgi:N-acetylmuramoyl-L-alanine amidase
MRPVHFLKTTLLSALTILLCHSQPFGNDTSITFRPFSGDSVLVSCIDSSDVLYMSLNDFIRPLQIPGIVNDSTKKIECLIASQLVRFTAQNPFVVITERTTNTAVIYQMPNKVIHRNDVFFVPVSAFVPLYSQISKQQLVFDAARMMLSIEKTSAYKNDIAGIQIENKLNGSLITILANKKLGDVESWLKPDGWLFVTITAATADSSELNATKPFGAVKKVLTFQSPTSLQLTFRVTPDVVQAEVTNDPASNNLLISLRTRSDAEKKELEKSIRDAKKQALAHGRDRWKLDVIVIDAGHGGKDPGCIGVAGTREKNITLDVALKLGELIENSLRGVKIVYTRSNDRFVELYKRAQIANEAGGKLFISIHCNAVPHKPSRMNGFEIYLLRPNRTEEAVSIASRENSVIQLEEGSEKHYRELTEEEFIIVTMAQSAYMKQSEQFAESAAGSMRKRLRIKNNGVKQAGFYVLVGASMPNVLVELGYLTNKNEEQILRSQEGQSRIADAIFRGIKEYKLKYEKSLQEGMTD